MKKPRRVDVERWEPGKLITDPPHNAPDSVRLKEPREISARLRLVVNVVDHAIKRALGESEQMIEPVIKWEIGQKESDGYTYRISLANGSEIIGWAQGTKRQVTEKVRDDVARIKKREESNTATIRQNSLR